MDDLIAFLKARLDDRERSIKARLYQYPDPEVALAEVGVQRKLIDQAEREINGAPSRAYDHESEVERTRAALWGEVLLLLALPYADHPDYREEWRP